MISIITSTYNRAEKLRNAIDSVVNQSYKDWELIIVDDASTDNTEEVVKEYLEDPRIHYIKRSENFGTDTRPKNEGILASKGGFICFLDDDNKYRPDHLMVLLKAIEKEPELDGVYGDRFVYLDGKPLGVGVKSDWNPYALFGQNYIDTSDVLVRRECIFDLGGFDENYRKFIDWNLWVRAVKARKRFKRVPMVITDYYVDDTSKSRRPEDTEGPLKPKWHPLSCQTRLDFLGKKKEPKVAIYSLTYDRLELTKECFASLYETAGYPFDHFILDNGSTDGTKEYLDTLSNPNGKVIALLSDDNKGISIGSNMLLDAILVDRSEWEYDIVIKVDNDAFFKSKDWLPAMIKVWKVWPGLATSLYVEGLLDNPGGAPRIEYMSIADELIGMTKHLGGICHFVDASAYKDFRWDETGFLHGMQDTEFSQYLNFNGFYNGYLENWYVEHRYGTKGQQEKYPSYFERRKTEKRTRYEKNGE